MSDVGIRALKQNASEVVARVVAGDSVTITDRGRRVALLSPLPDSPLAGLIAAGRARLPRIAKGDLPAPLAGPALSDALRAARDAERY